MSLSPDTLKGMHQWWSEIASLNLVIFGGTGCHKEKHHKSTASRPQRSYYCLKTRSVWQEMILFSKSGLHWWCHVCFRGKWWTYKVCPATGRTLSLQRCSRLCSWSCCCGPVMKGWIVAALNSDPMLWSENAGTHNKCWNFTNCTLGIISLCVCLCCVCMRVYKPHSWTTVPCSILSQVLAHQRWCRRGPNFHPPLK